MPRSAAPDSSISLIAHVGAIAHPAVLRRAAGRQRRLHVRRDARGNRFAARWATVAFLLALFGFGAKAGLLPLHVWLPEAHPAAPSPVSALMSGVMLKTAIYGLLRVTFDLLARAALVVGRRWRWRSACVTALFGVVFAAVQTDMKRLLAYSSIENIGIILAGIGLAILFRGVRHARCSPRSR